MSAPSNGQTLEYSANDFDGAKTKFDFNSWFIFSVFVGKNSETNKIKGAPGAEMNIILLHGRSTYSVFTNYDHYFNRTYLQRSASINVKLYLKYNLTDTSLIEIHITKCFTSSTSNHFESDIMCDISRSFKLTNEF